MLGPSAERAVLISSGVQPGAGSSFEAPYPLHYSSTPSNPPQQAEAAPGKEEEEAEEEAGARRRSAPAPPSLDQLTPQPTQKLPNRAPARAVGPVSLVRSPHMRMAAQILESYEAKLQGANVSCVGGENLGFLGMHGPPDLTFALTWLGLSLPLAAGRLLCGSC